MFQLKKYICKSLFKGEISLKLTDTTKQTPNDAKQAQGTSKQAVSKFTVYII